MMMVSGGGVVGGVRSDDGVWCVIECHLSKVCPGGARGRVEFQSNHWLYNGLRYTYLH